MIRCVQFCINHGSKVRRLDLADARLDFGPGYNVLIGPNGSGKSTVLKAIASCSLCKVGRTNDDRVKYITTETLNPLVGGTFASREEMIQGIRAMFLSHGKGVMDSLKNQWHGDESAVLIDSPETGQDYENCERVHRALLEMSERYQVIVATNSLVFMNGGYIIDLGDGYRSRLVEATRLLVARSGPNSRSNGAQRRDMRTGRPAPGTDRDTETNEMLGE